VKAMEEREREEKEMVLWELWQRRIKQYSFSEMIGFMDFAQPKHLNKTTSIESVEKEMIQFMEKVDADLQVIHQLENVNDHINAYLNTYDLGQAMMIVKQEQERRSQIEQAMKKTVEPSGKIAFLVSVRVENEKELKLLEMVLQANKFDYTTDKVDF
jgi:hypothetical protein